jgi:hypothetical protein
MPVKNKRSVQCLGFLGRYTLVACYSEGISSYYDGGTVEVGLKRVVPIENNVPH